ncbi:MAG: signal peptidase I [Ignavibacteria bacterium]|nr:signal peptidase I [Ignavibacteria bacterium]
MKNKGLDSLTISDVLVTMAAAIFVATILRVFVIGAFAVSAHSMENTLLDGDNILVSKIYAWSDNFERGDVIVFNVPDSIKSKTNGEPFVKRIIGLAGDTVVIGKESIFVNGIRIPSPSLSANPKPLFIKKTTRTIVPTGEVFVIGDNRPYSWDSRHWGTLQTENIIGKALVTYWSYGATPDLPTPHLRWRRIFRMVE